METRFSIIPILFSLLEISVIIIGVFFAVRFFRKEAQFVKNNGYSISKKWYWMIISSVVIMFISWVFNLGWFRVILTWIPIPLIHTIVFLVINIKSVNRVSAFRYLEKYIILSSGTYLLAYLLFPDFGDVDGAYCFFGLIRNGVNVGVMMAMSVAVFAVNIVVLVLEGIAIRKCKNQ